jgi:ATP dependent DNA ligase domain
VYRITLVGEVLQDNCLLKWYHIPVVQTITNVHAWQLSAYASVPCTHTLAAKQVMARLSGQMITCEYKYDGERSQIHLQPDGTLRFFTRNSEEATSKYPDLIPVMRHAAAEGVTSYVLDSEVCLDCNAFCSLACSKDAKEQDL